MRWAQEVPTRYHIGTTDRVSSPVLPSETPGRLQQTLSDRLWTRPQASVWKPDRGRKRADDKRSEGQRVRKSAPEEATPKEGPKSWEIRRKRKKRLRVGEPDGSKMS